MGGQGCLDGWKDSAVGEARWARLPAIDAGFSIWSNNDSIVDMKDRFVAVKASDHVCPHKMNGWNDVVGQELPWKAVRKASLTTDAT